MQYYFFRIFIFFFILFVHGINAKENDNHKVMSILMADGIHFYVNTYRTARSFGAVGDGVTDDTHALRKAFSSGINLNLEGKKYLIDISKPGLSQGLLPSNHTTIEGHGAEIILKPNNLVGFSSMITLNNSVGVKIYDLKLTGDVKNHIGSEGEWGMGFSIFSSKDCELHRVEANEMWGDGFYVASFSELTNEGGGIFNSSARANRRAGITVVTCNDFLIKNCTFTDTGTIKYTSPAPGVDIEPNPGHYDSINGLKLINTKTENNIGGGILFVPRNLAFSTDPNPLFNIYIEKFISKNDGNKNKYWFSSSLRFVEYYSQNTYNGLIKIKGYEVISLIGGLPFRWERNTDSSLSVHAVDLKVDGVFQDNYHY